MVQAWRWRPGSGDARKSRRAARAKDLADLPGWKHDEDLEKKERIQKEDTVERHASAIDPSCCTVL